ncbi:PSD1 and planctomycete cytochrome C domain-containing protein [bacterium]|nr:PSD1 and planctomycete cytochrome C domain-containing protein [bacterium]
MIGLLPVVLCILRITGVEAEDFKQPPEAAQDDIVQQPIRFQEEIEPLFRRHCIRCHGENKQEADLRLDQRGDLIAADTQGLPDETDSGIIMPGKAINSTLFHRISDPTTGDLMPLDSEPLSASEMDTIVRWIDEGAEWIDNDADDEKEHWSYQPVVRPNLPEAKYPQSPIDRFIGRRLKRKGLDFSPLVKPERLIRRVSLALTGLPPTVAQVTQFTNDPSQANYEKVVDQLLDSPQYGERWAVQWLDLARYADSNGFQADQIRDNWAYRDWVIQSFNDSKPFNQFVIDQLAGDLVEQPTIDQQIATGFHRMTTCNVEAGVDPEANRVNQVVDRVNTTATVFLGTTLECAQCHDHKYDPFSQTDYYQLFAYFNNTALEVKKTSEVTWDFYGPTMDLPMASEQKTLREKLQQEASRLQSERTKQVKEGKDHYQKWVLQLAAQDQNTWTSLIPSAFETTGNESFEVQADGAVLLAGEVPDKVQYHLTFDLPDRPVTAIKLDALTDDSIPGKGPGRGDPVRSNIILSEIECRLINGDSSELLALTQPRADFSQAKWPVAAAIDGDPQTGWAVSPQLGEPHWSSFQFSEPIQSDQANAQIRITLKQFYGQGRVIGKPRISITHSDPGFLDVDPKWLKLASKEKRSADQDKQLQKEFESRDSELQRIDQQIAVTNKKLNAVKPDTTLVMQENNTPRETFVLMRGEYESQGKKVETGIPSTFSKLAEKPVSGNRLDLARWITSRENPLLARVTINRWWSEFFGRGLVSTPEDFGTQGEPPTHPDLLDWLACDLMDNGWSMKQLHKQIVMSHTFQQSSALTAENQSLDIDNRWLGRGPRYRMKAEFIRDNALSISGLLSTKQSGPPIMPFQPDNLWRSVGRNQPKWIAAENEDRFRRGIYVVWKRAAPYPSFINFDAPDRGACTVERGRSNTPLQALTLLNDPAYVEMALAFSDRIISESPSSGDIDRIAFAMQLAVSRPPTEQEIKIIRNLLDKERKTLRQNPSLIQSRTKLPYKGMSLRTESTEELAAWMAVANALLNLDETMSL